MTQEQFEEIKKTVGDQAAQEIKRASDEIETKYKNLFVDAQKGLVKADDIQAFRDDVAKMNKTLEDRLKEQGTEMGKLQEKLNASVGGEDPFVSLHKDIEAAKNDLGRIKMDRTGQKAFTLKVAGTTGTIGIGGNASSIQEQGGAAAMLRLGDGPVFANQRGLPFILNFVTVGQTNAPALMWFDEITTAGAFAVVAEGAIKPLVQYIFERRTATYRKAAGYTAITDEADMDFPRLVSDIRRLMQIDCRNAMNALILTDLVSSASSYSYPAMALKVDNADNYAAIGAAIGQLQSLYYTPNILVLNPADAWIMRLQKASDGHYVMPPFDWNGQKFEFGQIIVDPRVAAGNFFIGDGSVYNVLLRGDIIVRIGFANDDFIRNQYSMVVEQYFYNYIPNARKAGLIYGNFAAIKTAIELP